MKLELNINSDKSYLAAQRRLSELYESDHWLEVSIKTGSTRTNQQNKAMHKYFELLAEALNAAGYGKRATFNKMKEGFECDWSAAGVKEDLWRPIQLAKTGKESSADLERTEVSQIFELLNRWTSTELGVGMDFPHNEDSGK